MTSAFRRSDVWTGVALAVFLVVMTAVSVDEERRPDVVAYALCACAGLAFTVRWRAPLTVFLVALGCVVVYVALGYAGGPIYVAAFAGTLVLLVDRPGNLALATIVAGVAVLDAVSVLERGWAEPHAPVITAIWLGGAVLVAKAIRARAADVAALQGKAIAEERLRIARDVHDVVGHSLATIALRAGVAQHLLDEDREHARISMSSIHELSRKSLGELSTMLGLLPENGAHGRAPVPRLTDLAELVVAVRDAGLGVELDMSLNGEPIPEVVGVAGYRIAQEALTNVARHAGPGACAQVRVSHSRDGIEVTVADDGLGASAELTPRGGLTGMRERAAAVGGQLDVDTAPGRGFRIRALLPTRDAA